MCHVSALINSEAVDMSLRGISVLIECMDLQYLFLSQSDAQVLGEILYLSSRRHKG